MIYKVTYNLYFGDEKIVEVRKYDCANIVDLCKYYVDLDFCTLNKLLKPDCIEVKVDS